MRKSSKPYLRTVYFDWYNSTHINLQAHESLRRYTAVTCTFNMEACILLRTEWLHYHLMHNYRLSVILGYCSRYLHNFSRFNCVCTSDNKKFSTASEDLFSDSNAW